MSLKLILKQYVFALIVALLLASFFASQLSTGEITLRIISLSIANTSIALLGIVLLLGPFSRLFNIFDRFINYRKELGVTALFAGSIHAYLVMFPLARRGPLGIYQNNPLPAYLGLTALVIMFILFLISFSFIKNALGASLWWKMQYNGVRLAGLAALGHVSIMRYQEWSYYLFQNEKLVSIPPNLAIGLFSLFVLLVRLSELFGARIARILCIIFALLLAAILAWAFLR